MYFIDTKEILNVSTSEILQKSEMYFIDIKAILNDKINSQVGSSTADSRIYFNVLNRY